MAHANGLTSPAPPINVGRGDTSARLPVRRHPDPRRQRHGRLRQLRPTTRCSGHRRDDADDRPGHHRAGPDRRRRLQRQPGAPRPASRWSTRAPSRPTSPAARSPSVARTGQRRAAGGCGHQRWDADPRRLLDQRRAAGRDHARRCPSAAASRADRSLARTAGPVDLTGTLNNADATLPADATTGPWNLRGGTIRGALPPQRGGAAGHRRRRHAGRA